MVLPTVLRFFLGCCVFPQHLLFIIFKDSNFTFFLDPTFLAHQNNNNNNVWDSGTQYSLFRDFLSKILHTFRMNISVGKCLPSVFLHPYRNIKDWYFFSCYHCLSSSPDVCETFFSEEPLLMIVPKPVFFENQMRPKDLLTGGPSQYLPSALEKNDILIIINSFQ